MNHDLGGRRPKRDLLKSTPRNNVNIPRQNNQSIEVQKIRQQKIDKLHNSLVQYAKSSQNVLEIKAMQNTMQNSQDKVILYRGVSYSQAFNIINNKTLGGEKPSNKPLSTPTETEIIAQIASGNKNLNGNKIEEWSMSPDIANQFGKNTLVLACAVRKDNLVDTKSGEKGVLGYANVPLENVAIIQINPKPSYDKTPNGA